MEKNFLMLGRDDDIKATIDQIQVEFERKDINKLAKIVDKVISGEPKVVAAIGIDKCISLEVSKLEMAKSLAMRAAGPKFITDYVSNVPEKPVNLWDIGGISYENKGSKCIPHILKVRSTKKASGPDKIPGSALHDMSIMTPVISIAHKWLNGRFLNPRVIFDSVNLTTLSKIGKPFCPAGKIRPIGVASNIDKILESAQYRMAADIIEVILTENQ